MDYGVVVAGRVELEMESGEVKVLGVGDTIVQRGTLHRWRNAGGEGEWYVSFFFFLHHVFLLL